MSSTLISGREVHATREVEAIQADLEQATSA
jgi:hypothetical protein